MRRYHRVTSRGPWVASERRGRLPAIRGPGLTFEKKSVTGSPDAYRQRLARARAAITEFMKKRCGVFSAKNPCRCSLQVPRAMRVGMLDPSRLQLVRHPVEEGTPEAALGEVLDVLDAATIYRQQPRFAAPDSLARAVRETLAAR